MVRGGYTRIVIYLAQRAQRCFLFLWLSIDGVLIQCVIYLAQRTQRAQRHAVACRASMNVNHASYFRLHASYFVYLAQRAQRTRSARYGTTLVVRHFQFPIFNSQFHHRGLCYNIAETVTYSEE